MRTLRYMFGSKPRNMDDCVDYYLHRQETDEKPAVSFHPRRGNQVTELYVSDLLVVGFDWEFDDGTHAEYQKSYQWPGGSPNECSIPIYLRNVQARVEDDLRTLSRLGIDVSGFSSTVSESGE